MGPFHITNSGTAGGVDKFAADFSLVNSGVIESAGTRAVYVDMNDTSLAGD